MSQDLIWLFTTPLIMAALIWLCPACRPRTLQAVAVGMSCLPLFILLSHFDSWVGKRILYEWIPALNINFDLSVDTLSLIFLYLTAIVVPISLLAARNTPLHNPKAFYSLVLALQALLIGFFTSRDLILFILFWESMLLPLYFIIAKWGGAQRQAAAFKFIIYMIAGSALMLLAAIALYFAEPGSSGESSFQIDTLHAAAANTPYSSWIAAIFLLAFAVKTPLFPFHAWLPDTYYQAPTTGSILLAALLSKAGIYGILRIGTELFAPQLVAWSPILIGLAISGVFYGGLAAWMQSDFKRLLAYSSLAHVNFVLAGIFAWQNVAYQGAILQAFNHGITITALFLIAGWLEKRLHSTAIKETGGLAKFMPKLCWLSFFFVLSSIALPGTNNFASELLIFFGLFTKHPWITAFFVLNIVLSALYMLRWFRLIYLEESKPQHKNWLDIGTREYLTALPLIALVLLMGIYPQPVLKQIDTLPQVPTTAVQSEPSL
jgi:NADH-quinone oxidoreductase subunit M